MALVIYSREGGLRFVDILDGYDMNWVNYVQVLSVLFYLDQ